MNIRIEKLTSADADLVFDWIFRLLRELGEEGEELGELERDRVIQKWKERESKHYVLAAKSDDNRIVGILTLSVAFAIYANGEYGVIDEMYMDPAHRSAGIGAIMINEVKRIGRQNRWSRIDVTAPESARWERTRKFYETLGFVFTGPKLKLLL